MKILNLVGVVTAGDKRFLMEGKVLLKVLLNQMENLH